MAGNNSDLEKRLWSAADELRANSKLKASEYSVPVLGLIFLRYAGARFDAAQQTLQEEAEGRSSRRKGISKSDYQVRAVCARSSPSIGCSLRSKAASTC
jgi:type I restriction enzyme M protein